MGAEAPGDTQSGWKGRRQSVVGHLDGYGVRVIMYFRRSLRGHDCGLGVLVRSGLAARV